MQSLRRFGGYLTDFGGVITWYVPALLGRNQDDQEKTSPAERTILRDLSLDLQVFLSAAVAERADPWNWFHTCTYLRDIVQPAFAQRCQLLAWRHLLQHSKGNVQQALASCLRETKLPHMQHVLELDIDASHAVDVISRFPECRSLSIRRSMVHLTDDTVRAIVMQCPNIEKLCFDGTYQTSRRAVAQQGQGLPVRAIYMCPSFGNDALGAIAKHCPKLRTINLTSCVQITDNGLKVLTTGCPALEHVCIAGCGQITDASIDVILSACPQLTTLDLAWCSTLTDYALAVIATKGKKLIEINLSGLSRCTTRSVESLLKGCPALRTIHLNHWNHPLDGTLEAIAHLRPELSGISLVDCPLISDRGLAGLANGCKNLETIDLSFCPNITETAVGYLKTMCCSLRGLAIVGTSVSQEVAEALANDSCLVVHSWSPPELKQSYHERLFPKKCAL